MLVEQKAKEIAELLKLLANQHRLLILCALMTGPLTVSQIYEHTPSISSSALSQHLSQLKMAGILDSEKNGMNVTYRIQDKRIISLIGAIKENYCT